MKQEKSYIIVLDQGTSSSRTIAYDLAGETIASSSEEYDLNYPHPSWVEVSADVIWQTQENTLKEVLSSINPEDVKAIGITNQRETIIAWDPSSGKALAPAIIWQCRRTADFCQELNQSIYQNIICTKTGLKIDPYFSASKIHWLIENNELVKKHYDQDKIVFGTVDSWLIYNLTKDVGAPTLFTDNSNASRTMLYSLENNNWDQELLEIFKIKESALCKIKPSNANFGQTNLYGLNAPIHGVLGDQQSSLLGHGAINENDLKCTFGTGAFLLQNTGDTVQKSDSGLLSTVAWTIEDKIHQTSKTTYANEGSIFVAGSVINWLKNQLGLVDDIKLIDKLAAEADINSPVVFIPTFSGLGSPHWNSEVQGSLFGLTAGTEKSEIIKASLEGVAQQVADLLELQELSSVKKIKIDGGMCKSLVFDQTLADLTDTEIEIAKSSETTAYGAFCMAAYGIGVCNPFIDNSLYKSDVTFSKKLSAEQRVAKRKAWQRALKSTINYYTE